MSTVSWLSVCAALAAGEYLATQAPSCAVAWPFVMIVALLVAFFGYGLSFRLWHLSFAFLMGVALFLFASVDIEANYREKPWMREAKRHAVNSPVATGFTARIRKDLLRRVSIGLDHDRETVALNRAILLGERSKLPLKTRRVFVNSGTMHVFAISGLHVMVIATVLRLLLTLCLVPKRWSGVAALPFLWGYVHVIGDAPSAIRAAMMASFGFLAPVFWRQPNGIVAWAITFLLVHIANPLQIVDVGSALSFAVMLAILMAIEQVRGIESKVCQSLAISFAAWVAGVPISAHVFGRVTPGGLLANLVLLPTAQLMVYIGATGVVASFVSESLAAHINNLAALFTSMMVGVSSAVSRLPGANIEVIRWSVGECLAWYVGSVLLFALFRLYLRHRVF